MSHCPHALEVRGASKSFGGVQAVCNADLIVRDRSIHGLIGPNGAGKTSLFNLITGLIPADAGEFRLGGEAYQPTDLINVTRLGIARTFQNIRLFPQLTVLENVLVGRLCHQSPWHSGLLGALWSGAAYRRAQEMHEQRAESLLQQVGLADQADQCAGTLSYGAQRRLEIARALATEPRLLALDEPAAGMNPVEKSALTQLIRAVATAPQGPSVLIIEHDVGMVMSLCDRITVLHQGAVLAEGTPADIQASGAVREAYLGSTEAPSAGAAR